MIITLRRGDFDILETNGRLARSLSEGPPQREGLRLFRRGPQKEVTYVRHVVTLFAPAS